MARMRLSMGAMLANLSWAKLVDVNIANNGNISVFFAMVVLKKCIGV
jgi:hypothetical protein